MAHGEGANCSTIRVERQCGVSEGVEMGMGGRERVLNYAAPQCSLLGKR
jgi:hypothetical protein